MFDVVVAWLDAWEFAGVLLAGFRAAARAKNALDVSQSGLWWNNINKMEEVHVKVRNNQ